MTHVPLPIAAQSSRAALDAKLVEHDDALNVLEAVNPLVPGTATDSTSTGLIVDYALPANTGVLVFTHSGDAQFTGMVPGVAGQVLDVWMLGAGTMSFYDSNTNSLVANRLLIAGSAAPGDGSSVAMVQGGMARFRFDGTNWWVVVLWNASAPSGISAASLATTSDITSGGSVHLNTSGPTLRAGAGTPLNAVVGNIGDLYLRTDGAADTTLYLKTSGRSCYDNRLDCSEFLVSVSFNKFNCFVQDVGQKLHNLNSDTLNVYLTNTTPVATNTVYNTPADLSTGGGYTAGGAAITGSAYSQTSGTATLTGTGPVFTATTGFGPFRYAVIYNETASGKNLIGWFDYGTSISPGASETFTIVFGASILTLA